MPIVLFDTDPGVDDAVALMYLHRHPDVEIAGITTVAGNATIDTVTRNAQFLVEKFGIDAPVARGAAAKLNGVAKDAADDIHGVNGLGDVPIDGEITRPLDPRPAYRFIIDTIRARPGEVTILGVGMLTNVAQAMMHDPEIVPMVRNVVIMGGAFGIGGHSGNISPVAEANIFCDPEAADIVCTADWPLQIIGLDVTERVIMTPPYLEALRESGFPEGRFVWDVTRGYYRFHVERDGVDGIFSHDPSAAVCVTNPEAFTFRRGPVRVVTGGVALGMTLQHIATRSYPANGWDDVIPHDVAVDADVPRVLDLFAAQFTR